MDMFRFNIDYEIANSAKNQHLPLRKLFSDNGKLGYLVYRGVFGHKHNFAYVQLCQVMEKDLHTSLYNNHLDIKKHYN